MDQNRPGYRGNATGNWDKLDDGWEVNQPTAQFVPNGWLQTDNKYHGSTKQYFLL